MVRMRRRTFLSFLAAAAVPATRKPPNILFIMPDQWRGMDLGSLGNRQVRTPNLDRLALEGFQFRSMSANSPVCTPARSMLLTGRYCYATGTAVNDVPLRDEETSIAEILKDRGYYTGFIGKWHVQGGMREPGFVPPGPRRQGFEFWAANICSHDYFHMHYFRDDPKPISMPVYDTFAWTDLALEFLDKSAERAQPFCLYLQYPTPHDPYLLPPGYETMYSPERIELRKNWEEGAKRGGTAKDIAGYYAAIACLDDQIGRVLKRLGDLGLRENTIVVFTSDHGNMLGSHRTFNKRKPWEESTNVPGIFRWPSGIKPAGVSDAPISHVDIVPTLLGLCGVRPPANMHGFDYSTHILRGSKRTPDFAYLMSHGKTELNEFEPWRGLRTRRWKYARFKNEPWMLHDLAADPFELSNLAKDKRFAKLMVRFDREIEGLMKRTGDRWDELLDAPYR